MLNEQLFRQLLEQTRQGPEACPTGSADGQRRVGWPRRRTCRLADAWSPVPVVRIANYIHSERAMNPALAADVRAYEREFVRHMSGFTARPNPGL